MFPQVIPELKLSEVLWKVFAGDVDVSAINAALQLRPERFDPVDASAIFTGVFTKLVVHFDVVKTGLVDVLIPAKFVGLDRRAGEHVREDNALHSDLITGKNNGRNQFTVTLQHADNTRLVTLVARAFALNRSADKGFVNFNVMADPAKRGITVNLAHVFADFVTNAPRGFVGNAKLPLQFLGADTVARRGEQIHSVEPLLKRRAGLLERRASHRADLVGTPRTFVYRTLLNTVKLANFLTLRAFALLAKTDIPKMRQTSIVSGEAVKKLEYGLRGHFCSFQYRNNSKSAYMRQRDNPQINSG